MPTKQGTDELVLIRKVGDRKDANKVMLVTELERETEKDRDTEATFDGSVNSGGTLESTVTINCYMDQKDTLCDEIEDATEDDTPYELWVINKRVKMKMVNIKLNIDKVIGTVSLVLMKQTVSLNLKQNLAFILKQRGYATLPQAIEANKAAYGFHDTIAADPADDGLAESIPQPTEAETV